MAASKIALIGHGVVGRGLTEVLARAESSAPGATIPQVAGAVVRRLDAPERAGAPAGFYCTQPGAFLADPDVRVVVEVLGGTEPARTWVLAALDAGKAVVTANKELLARHADELLAAARRNGVPLLFEAAVGGGVPIIRTLRQYLASGRVDRVDGIANATSNFCLEQMELQGASAAEAVAEARRQGLAEADPSADLDGSDAFWKAVLLARVAFRGRPDPADYAYDGIQDIGPEDFGHARDLDRTIRLTAAVWSTNGRLGLRVGPTLLPLQHPLATVHGASNAFLIAGDPFGSLLLQGIGAGPGPTAAALLADVLDCLHGTAPGAEEEVGPILPQGPDEPHAWYARTTVPDESGVLARGAGHFAHHDVSLARVIQPGGDDAAAPGRADIVWVTHPAPAARVRAALADLAAEGEGHVARTPILIHSDAPSR